MRCFHCDKDFQYEKQKSMVVFKCSTTKPNMRALPISNLGYILELQKLIKAVSSHLQQESRNETRSEGISDSDGKIISFQPKSVWSHTDEGLRKLSMTANMVEKVFAVCSFCRICSFAVVREALSLPQKKKKEVDITLA